MTKCTTPTVSFPRCKGRQVIAGFDGGEITSDGGALLLRQLDREMGLTRAIARRLDDARACAHLQCALPHLENLMNSARMVGIKRGDQIFNVNRFSVRHRMEAMDSWQVESFYQKLSQICGYQMSPHRFRHTLGTEVMKEPDRNLHIVKALLGHSNISTTLEYVEVDIGSLRSVLEGRV